MKITHQACNFYKIISVEKRQENSWQYRYSEFFKREHCEMQRNKRGKWRSYIFIVRESNEMTMENTIIEPKIPNSKDPILGMLIFYLSL